MLLVYWALGKVLYYISLLFNLRHKRKASKIKELGKIHLIYRISDAGYKKVKPDYINNKNCLINALTHFAPEAIDWTIICDNCSKATMDMIYEAAHHFHLRDEQIKTVSEGDGAKTFRIALNIALNYESNDIVYFLENDYIHRSGSADALKRAFMKFPDAKFVSLYDHFDKYEDDYFWSIINLRSKVYFDGANHWRSTNSTTMTFAARVSTLKKYKRIFLRYTNSAPPRDNLMFLNLDLELANTMLFVPIPSFSTHGETKYLAPVIDWREENCSTLNEYEQKTGNKNLYGNSHTKI